MQVGGLTDAVGGIVGGLGGAVGGLGNTVKAAGGSFKSEDVEGLFSPIMSKKESRRAYLIMS